MITSAITSATTNLRIVDDLPALNALADRILDPNRRNTLVILSVRSRNRRAGYDPHDMADAMAGTDVTVHLLTDPWYGATLSSLVNGRLTAYNGAAAVVPAYGPACTFLPDRDPLDTVVDHALEHAAFTGRGASDPTVGQERELRRLRGEVKRLNGELKRASDPAAHVDVIPPSDLYPSGLLPEWLDLAVKVMWALTTSANDKTYRPLPEDWRYDGDYATLLAASPIKADVIRCMVRVLIGVDRGHPLHDGQASAPIVRNTNGGIVWRSYVKQNTPDAARLHWTRDADGTIVFLAFGGHDDLL